MRVLRIINTMNPTTGGPCQGIRNSVPTLKTLGVKTDVLTMDDPEEKFVTTDPFPVYAIGRAKTPWGYNANLKAWLGKYADVYDVIIVHGLWLYHSFASVKVVAEIAPAKRPLIYIMPHGMLDPYFQKSGERRLKALRNELYWRLLEGPTVRRADGLLFTTGEELELARHTFPGYRPKAELNVSYGVPKPPVRSESMMEAFYDRFPLLKDKPFLLFLSRIHTKKGLDILVDAYQSLIRAGKSLPPLLIAGPGWDTPFGQQIKAKIGSESTILPSDLLSGDLKWGAFYGSEAFVLPSHQENFGIAVAEALACGKPVLTTDKVNIWRELKAGGGALIAEDNRESFEAILGEWVQLNDLDKQFISKKAADTYDTYFSVEIAAKKMYDVFSEQIEKHKHD